jgi:hypothetical protein
VSDVELVEMREGVYTFADLEANVVPVYSSELAMAGY